jgi:SAM-dependent methyltransferase
MAWNYDIGLAFGYGYFDHIEYLAPKMQIIGWMLLLDQQFDKFILFINKKYTCESTIIERNDVDTAFPFIAHAKYTGFHFDFDIDIAVLNMQPSSLIEICVVGISNGAQQAKLKTYYSYNILDDDIDVTPQLMKRATGYEQKEVRTFWKAGLKTFQDYWDLACRYQDLKQLRTFLDWGCGCGRVTLMFKKLTPIPEIHGCDIDPKTIEWCKKNLQHIQFNVIPAFPPTMYPDNYFDLVIGNSVFTHLTKEMQIAWLKEMRRIIKKDGLFLASVHGEFATYMLNAKQFSSYNSVKDFLKSGFNDHIRDGNLNDIAPQDYYRATFQSRNYTIKVFGKYFEILDYIERGSFHFQDIVVMKKRKYPVNQIMKLFGIKQSYKQK